MPRYRAGSARTASTASTGSISESAVVYRSAGGHSHDGLNSSLIDMSKYAIWDFDISTIYTNNSRYNTQLSNIERFKGFITNHIANDVLGPAGVTLGENVINARNIISGSITTDLLRTDAIKSTNYSYTSGDFSTAGTFLNLSDGSITSQQFYIDSSGNAGFAGDISGASGTFTGGLSIGSSNNIFKVNSTGDLWIGHAIETSAPFRVVNTGAVTASNLTVTGGSLTIGSSNNVFKVASDGDMWLGHATQSSAPFQVTKAGALTASSATITGTINATAGYIGSATTGFDISSNSITSQDFIPGGENNGRGKLSLYSYGDIVIDSSPTSGPHSGQTYKTGIVGEYLYIEKTSSGDKPRILIGNTSGYTDEATISIYKNGSTKASMYMSSSAGNLLLYDSAGTLKINLVGSTGVLAGRTFEAYNSSGSVTAKLQGSDGSIRAGNINGGYNNSSTNASGQFTVSHGLNGTPDFVVITPAQHSSGTPDWNVQYVVTSKNSSTFTVTLYEGLNDTVANDSQACYWFAGFSVHV